MNDITQLSTLYSNAIARAEKAEEALREMVYETTHLSPERDDGSHDCRISRNALAKARAALALPPPPVRETP